MGDQGLAEVEDSAQVHVHDHIPLLRADLHQLERLRDAGVVDQDVDLAERLEGSLARPLAAVAVGHVAGEAAVPGSQPVRGALRRILVQIHDRNARTVVGEQTCRRQSDPRGLAAPEMTALFPSSNIDASFV